MFYSVPSSQRQMPLNDSAPAGRSHSQTMIDRLMTVFLREVETGRDRPYTLAPGEFPSKIGVFCDESGDRCLACRSASQPLAVS